MSTSEVRASRRGIDVVRARYLAESGFERGMQFLKSSVSSSQDPLVDLAGLFVGGEITPFTAER